MNVLFLNTFYLTALILLKAQIGLAKPIITQVEIVSQDSLRIVWKIERTLNVLNLIRFQVFYKGIDEDETEFLEWPAQITKVRNELDGETYNSYSFDKPFDCYNECIRDIFCDFVVHKNFKNENVPNCLMKLKINNDKIVEQLDYNNDVAEYVKISEYRNEAILRRISTNKNYSFSVKVYDQASKMWSKLSDPFEFIGREIEIELKEDGEKNSNGQIVSWQKSKEFENYTISRYNILIWTLVDDQETYGRSIIPVLENIAYVYKYQLSPDYYKLENRFTKSPTERECFQKCLSNSMCVRYAYFGESKRCYDFETFDLAQSQLRAENTDVYSIKSDLNKYGLKSLKANQTYRIQLQFICPLGTIGYSNKIDITGFLSKKNETLEIDMQPVTTQNNTTTPLVTLSNMLEETTSENKEIEYEELTTTVEILSESTKIVLGELVEEKNDLNQNRIDGKNETKQTVEKISENNDGSKITTVLILVGIFILAIGVCVFVLYRFKKSKNSPPTESASSAKQENVSNDNKANKPLLDKINE